MRTARLSSIAAAAALALVAGVSTAAAAPVAPAAGGGTVKTVLSEFRVVTAVKSIKAGKVTFAISNSGKRVHELVVVKTDLAPAKLRKANGRADESRSVGEIGDVLAGKSGKLTLTLKPGKYVLLCNLPGHFAAGQWSAFTVK